MHGFNSSVPQFSTRVRGTHIVVTPDIVYEVLHVPRVAYPNYPGYDHQMSLCLCSVRLLLFGVIIRTPIARPLLKVQDF